MTPRRRTLVLEAPRSATSVVAALCPDDTTAIAEGRLFADGERIADERRPLAAGVTVTWYAPRNADHDEPRVLGERAGILAVYKPAAWSSEPDLTGTRACLSRHLLEQLKLPELHIATRLDVGVSGLVLATTHAASRRHVTRLIEQGSLHREYLAIASGAVPAKGRWTGSVEAAKQDKAREAITDYRCLAQATLPPGTLLGLAGGATRTSLVRFEPKTGRRHQLRIHASRSGHCLLGDRRYDGPKRLILPNGRVIELHRILLHAVGTTLTLPSGDPWSIRCPVDEEMGRYWEWLGGNDDEIPE